MSVSGFTRSRSTPSLGPSVGGNTAPTLSEIRLALRLDDDLGDDERLEQIAEAAVALANRQAPDAPGAVAREAMLRFIGAVWEAPSGEVLDQPGLWRLSGAKSLLSTWQVRRAGLIG